MARIKVIEHIESEGELFSIYEDLLTSRGKLADVHKIQSLRPKSIVKHMDLYMEIMFTRSDLSRAKREMIAVIVSVNNKCLYCQTHHGEALNHYWKNNERLAKLKSDFNFAELSPEELALCEFAKHLTLYPGEHEANDHTSNLKKNGFTDAAILDAVLVISYFNFVNRIVLSLGVQLEEHSGKGFKY